MNQNPYAPPQAEVVDVTVDEVLASDETIFFPCSLLKLALMSLSTLGLYHIYWFYK
ncbi:MAG TPA: hypothetical protein VG962_11220 [Steroidobacteraceae bacterium]|nr:hypothetical protein [Steroidobacteraceae bacterium]